MTIRPALTGDPERNQRVLQASLAATPGGTLELPAGVHTVSAGLTVPTGWTLRGQPAPDGRDPVSWLASTATDGQPVVHVVGSDVSVSDLGLRPAASQPGEHGGDRGTGLTVGRYLYDAAPQWIGQVDIRRIQVYRPGDRAANSIALMGAVRDVDVHDVTVLGGWTGVAVHWGAVGTGVEAITGASYHPHRLRLGNVRVTDAIEGFYLSSVHDVTVTGACLADVQMGFRLLPGDNTDRYSHDPEATIGQRIDIRDVCVRWHGDRYGVRIAGWGRSEVDGEVSLLRYGDTVVRDCVLRRSPDAAATSWAPVVVDRADGVQLVNIRVDSDADGACCPLGTA